MDFVAKNLHRMRAYIIPSCIVLLLTAGSFQQLYCCLKKNVYGIKLIKQEFDNYDFSLSFSKVDCPDLIYLKVYGQIFLQRFDIALDVWINSSQQGSEREKLFPGYFQDALTIRQMADIGDWTNAVSAYRQIFGTILSGRFMKQQRVHSLMSEYQKALIGMYNQDYPDGLNAADIFRWAAWLWRSGKEREAIQILQQKGALSDITDYYQQRFRALESFLNGEQAVIEGKREQAAGYYTQISSEQRDLYLRSTIRLSQLSGPDSKEKYDQILQAWPPMIALDANQIPDAILLEGCEILEKETIQDSGIVSLFLFGRGIPPTTYPIIWQNADRWIAEVFQPNLLRDPGFEWQTETTQISDWWGKMYHDSGNPPEKRLLGEADLLNHIVCLENPPDSQWRRSGIAQGDIGVKPREKYLLMAHAKTSNDGSLTLMGDWRSFAGFHRYFWSRGMSGSDSTWKWLGGVLSVPEDKNLPVVWGIVVYAVNYERIGTGCIDDLILIDLKL